MEHRFLGRSGLRVSELCLGTMMFGERTDEQTSHQILDAFAEAGGDFIDTADVYGGDPVHLGRPGQGGHRTVRRRRLCGRQLQKAVDLARQHGWEAFVALQPLYNLLDRDAD